MGPPTRPPFVNPTAGLEKQHRIIRDSLRTPDNCIRRWPEEPDPRAPVVLVLLLCAAAVSVAAAAAGVGKGKGRIGPCGAATVLGSSDARRLRGESWVPALDNMCFGATKAWRLPCQVFSYDLPSDAADAPLEVMR